MEIDKKLFINAGINYIYELDEFPRSSVFRQVAKEFEEVLTLNNPDVLEKRRGYFGTGEAEDYLNRLIETDEGPIVAGIRHLGNDRDKPFVLIWPSFKISSLKNISECIKPHFEIFKPESICYWSRPDCNDSNVKIVQQRFIARIVDMPKHDLALSQHKQYYPWYQAEYASFHQEHPEFVNRIQTNSQELMDASYEEGLLYTLTEGDNRIGLVAAERDTFLDRPTIYLIEILIAKNYRGKGYAGRLLAGFVNRLNADYFVCEIDVDNVPSTKTALRSGQKVFSQENFVDVVETNS